MAKITVKATKPVGKPTKLTALSVQTGQIPPSALPPRLAKGKARPASKTRFK
jgi:hypothetical protein